MHRLRSTRGFTLIEILLVLAIIGIISGIAIPTYMGQRRRSRVIGDAMANAKVMAMLLESRKADNGIYGNAQTYNWTAGSAVGSAATLLPQFTPQGNSKMNYSLAIGNSGLGYTLTVSDPSLGSGVTAYQTDQTGAELVRLH
jgi:prepilin-type N-terminal cleavage/methylation domain-containing protein